MTPDREKIAADMKGKTIESAEWNDVDRYWVITFADGGELCVRLMIDIFREEAPR